MISKTEINDILYRIASWQNEIEIVEIRMFYLNKKEIYLLIIDILVIAFTIFFYRIVTIYINSKNINEYLPHIAIHAFLIIVSICMMAIIILKYFKYLVEKKSLKFYKNFCLGKIKDTASHYKRSTWFYKNITMIIS